MARWMMPTHVKGIHFPLMKGSNTNDMPVPVASKRMIIEYMVKLWSMKMVRLLMPTGLWINSSHKCFPTLLYIPLML